MMKQWKIIKILEVPDITLAKYNTAGFRGMESLLDFHQIFLRQWHRKGVLSHISLHLFYEYVPEQALGNRLNVYIGFHGEKSSLGNIGALLEASSLLGAYKYRIMDEHEATSVLKEPKFSKCCMLTRKEVVIKNKNEDEGGYYTVAEWEPNDEGRLRQLYALLKAVNEKITIRIDLYPEDWHDRIRDSLLKQIEVIQERSKKNSTGLGQRDRIADTAVKSYEDCIKQLDNTPLFRTNIFAFGQKFSGEEQYPDGNVEFTLDVMASETIEKGDYQIAEIDTLQDEFNAFLFLDEDVEARAWDVGQVLNVV